MWTCAAQRNIYCPVSLTVLAKLTSAVMPRPVADVRSKPPAGRWTVRTLATARFCWIVCHLTARYLPLERFGLGLVADRITIDVPSGRENDGLFAYPHAQEVLPCA